MNKKLVIFGIILLFVCSGMVAVVTGEIDATPNGPLQRLFNRLCDRLSYCRGTGVNIENITGNFTYDGTNFYIGEAQLHFGPYRYINAAISAIDYDGDGDNNETIFDELQGLVGTNITVGAHEQSENWYSVFTINGETYREPGKPIWAGLHTRRWRHKQPTNN